MQLILILFWLGVLYGLQRLVPSVFPYIVALTVLALLNTLPVIDDALRDLYRNGTSFWIGLVVILAGLYTFFRPLFITFGLLLALYFAGALQPLQGFANGVTGLARRAPVERFLCLQKVNKATARVYRVNQTQLGLSNLVLAGSDKAGAPVICGSTLKNFPVVGTYDIKPRKQLDLQNDEVMQKYIERPDLNRGHWEGHGTLGFIPSLRGSNYRFPIQIDQGYLSLPVGNFRNEGVEITRLQ